MKYTPSTDVLVGSIGEGDVLAAKQIRSVERGFYGVYQDNEQAPFLALQGKLTPGKAITNIKHEWALKDFTPRWDAVATITANNGTAAITITVDNVDYFRIGYQVEFFGGSGGTITQGVVTSKTAATSTLIVTSLDGTSTLPTLAAGNQIHVLSDSSNELSRRPTGIHSKPRYVYNYPQYLRYPTEIGIFELETAQYTGSEEDERIREDMLEIKMSAERILLWGKRGKRTHTPASGSAGTQLFMRGMSDWIDEAGSDNVLDWSGGSLTESTFREWLEYGPCRYGSKKKFFPMSTELFLKINDWTSTKDRIVSQDLSVLGISFMKYRAPGGRILYMHNHHMFEQQYEGHGMVIDQASLKLHRFGKHKMFAFAANIGEEDLAGKAFEWMFLAMLKVTRPEWNGKITA